MSIPPSTPPIVHGHSSTGKLQAALARRQRGHAARLGLLSYWEIACFATICTADMLSTLYWYLHGQATESNPLLSYWLGKSVTAFCIAKLVSFVPLLAICAIYRRRYPKLIVSGLRIAMVAYLLIYLGSVGRATSAALLNDFKKSAWRPRMGSRPPSLKGKKIRATPCAFVDPEHTHLFEINSQQAQIWRQSFLCQEACRYICFRTIVANTPALHRSR